MYSFALRNSMFRNNVSTLFKELFKEQIFNTALIKPLFLD